MFGGGVSLLFCSLYTQSPSIRRGSSCIVLLPSVLYRSATLWLWGFLVCLCWRGLWAPFDPVLGFREGNSQIFEVSRSFLKIFYHPQNTLTRQFSVWKGVLDPFKALFVPYFTLFRVADPFRHLYSCMSRRGEEEKTKSFLRCFS